MPAPATPDPASRATTDSRRDPAYDRRRLIAFFAGLLAFYGGAVLILRPGPEDIDTIALPVMFAPAFGALIAVLFARGRVQFGRLTRHLWLAFLPPLAILATTWLASYVTDVEVQPGNLLGVLAFAIPFGLLGSITAVGEEIGWRGFLWPLMRRHTGFWTAAAIMLPIWWLYHVPAVLWWGYGYVGGLPAFTVGMVGFILFVGVITERSNSLWPSVLAHGAWNSLVAAAFRAGLGGQSPSCDGTACEPFTAGANLFTGPQTLLGEFGWIAALTMLALGVATAVWHVRRPQP
ncbi:CPBP family intramembrane glutamic endopeptidase [Demequina pelophila]|uniref:CPBP family intramembrane glutamic endopeptidase n=1 Tax=Demequina pelophila TaxID=1638984 RepID=UPI0007847132|nr:type II CAAX endopeptidase family protein [Demequina pelophila]